jgi:hypothetical protein
MAVLASARGRLALTPTDGASRSGGRTIRLAADRSVGQRLSDFTLEDAASNRPISLYSFVGKKAIVPPSWGRTPVSNLYVPRLIELNRHYRAKGVVFLGNNSNAHETQKDLASSARGGSRLPCIERPPKQGQ